MGDLQCLRKQIQLYVPSKVIQAIFSFMIMLVSLCVDRLFEPPFIQKQQYPLPSYSLILPDNGGFSSASLEKLQFPETSLLQCLA